MNPSAQPAPVDRQARRRERTRTRLVDAARLVFARQGVDATRINDITEEADVGFGSFYNHFDSKDAIVAAVVEQAAKEAGEANDRATAGLDDPAEVVAVAHRSLIQSAIDDPSFGWLLVRLEISHDIVSAALGPYAARDLDRGIAAGRFEVDDRAAALIAAGGALFGVVRAVLQGHADETTAQHHAAAVLRIFGLTPGEAAEVASRGFPMSRPDDRSVRRRYVRARQSASALHSERHWTTRPD
jgi:AcrR family transcriptional regulator